MTATRKKATRKKATRKKATRKKATRKKATRKKVAVREVSTLLSDPIRLQVTLEKVRIPGYPYFGLWGGEVVTDIQYVVPGELRIVKVLAQFSYHLTAVGRGPELRHHYGLIMAFDFESDGNFEVMQLKHMRVDINMSPVGFYFSKHPKPLLECGMVNERIDTLCHFHLPVPQRPPRSRSAILKCTLPPLTIVKCR